MFQRKIDNVEQKDTNFKIVTVTVSNTRETQFITFHSFYENNNLIMRLCENLLSPNSYT